MIQQESEELKQRGSDEADRFIKPKPSESHKVQLLATKWSIMGSRNQQTAVRSLQQAALYHHIMKRRLLLQVGLRPLLHTLIHARC